MVDTAIRVGMVTTSPDMEHLRELKEHASHLLELLENALESHNFITVYGEVQRKIEANKTLKKQADAVIAVSDPRAMAIKKIEEGKKKKEKKRKQAEAAGKGMKRNRMPLYLAASEE